MYEEKKEREIGNDETELKRKKSVRRKKDEKKP